MCHQKQVYLKEQHCHQIRRYKCRQKILWLTYKGCHISCQEKLHLALKLFMNIRRFGQYFCTHQKAMALDLFAYKSPIRHISSLSFS